MVAVPILRPYQSEGTASILAAWQTVRNVLYVLPTGAGKTTTFSDILRNHVGAACVIAHRQELVGQISTSLAMFGVPHKIIGPRPVIKLILELQRITLGRHFYDPNAQIAVAGVDTLVRRAASLEQWRKQVSLWVQDEAHHLLRMNKWGTAAEMFPNARGLGVTATPERADGRGLGRHADGVFDTMIVGPTMRELMNDGYLADYRIFAPPGDLDLTTVRDSSDGDFNKDDVRTAVRRSHIIGDVVGHYLRIAPGQLGVTFASDVETAGDIADKYNAAGVPAAMVNAKTPGADRARLIADFRRGDLKQLVNVDLFGEGFDVPGIETVSMARPTQSYAVYGQQFGRALRPLPGKQHGTIIDHVGNVTRHRLPDGVKNWTLDRRERGAKRKRDPDAIPVTNCTACFRAYEATTATCPYCGHKPEPSGRSSPQQVDGDLCELSQEALKALRGELVKVDGRPRVPSQFMGTAAGKNIENMWRERQEAQHFLRQSIALWAGHRRAEGMADPEIYRRFYFKFGTDILSAQSFGRGEAEDLNARIEGDIQ